MSKYCIAFLFCLLVFRGFSQPICGFDGIHEKQLTDKNFVERQRIFEEQIQAYIAANPQLPTLDGLGTALYVIPVVVHVVHTGGAVGTIYNPTDAQIQSTIDYLNQCYDGTASGFSGGVGDIQIQFKLAQRDPNCYPTNGIDRVDGSSLSGYVDYGVKVNTPTGTSDLTLKNQSRWDPSRYYNVWVVNKLDAKDGTSGQFIAGYAYFAGSSSSVDGAVMLATTFKAGSKVLPHEIGHALNLYHPFQGSSNATTCPSNTNCSTQGDLVCDTDPITYNNTNGVVDFTCRTGINPCTGTAYSINTENNVMNYTNCFTLFTAGQKARMLAAMSLASRVTLANSTADDPPYSGSSICPPKIDFATTSTTVTEVTEGTIDCRGYKDYTYNMTIVSAPSANTTVSLSTTGTATPGLDYILTTNGNFSSPSTVITFPSGAYANKTFQVRIFDDAAVEPDETIIIDFTIASFGGNALKGDLGPQTITIKSNDTADPQPTTAQSAKIGVYSYNLTTSGTNHPLDAQLQSQKSVFLYKASELTAAGLSSGDITAFGLYLQKNSTRPYTNLQVRMGTTSSEFLINGSVIAVATGTVKSLASYNTVNGLNVFTLDAPFTWNGTSSVVVEICYDNVTADNTQVSDVCQGYSDGGDDLQGNFYWQTNANCNNSFTAVGYLSGGVKPVGYFKIGNDGPRVETLLNASATAYLGPYNDVYFYSANGNLLARIKNLTDFDYGCTQVKIDRAGTSAKAYNSSNTSEYVADKTIQVLPANSNQNGTYEITMYYTQAEILGWKTITGQRFADARILKSSNAVSSYTPGSVPQGQVTAANGTVSNYGTDSSITATFNNGFSGFAVGDPAIATSTIYIFNGNGLWTNTANWYNNIIPPAILPAGSQIIINPVDGGQCVLNIAQTIQTGASIVVNASKNLVIQGNLNVSN